MPTITTCRCGRRMVPNELTGKGLGCTHCDRPCVRTDADRFCSSCDAIGLKRAA